MQFGESSFVHFPIFIPEISVLSGTSHGRELAVEHNDMSQVGSGCVGRFEEEVKAELFCPDIESGLDVSSLELVRVPAVYYNEVSDVLCKLPGKDTN